MELIALPLVELSHLIKAKTVSPVEVVMSSLARLNGVDPRIGAFADVLHEHAVAAARVTEAEIRAGLYRGPLHGIPYAAKDLIDVKGRVTRSGSRQAPPPPAIQDSTVIRRLSEAGMILIGKTHTHEFAFGSITPQSRNPWNPGAITGGSSGGSAAAVAAGIVHVALGTDTGGSVRIPAALCGTVGLKPTFGRVSRNGVVPLSSSLDHVGVLSRDVLDASWALTALAGNDPQDPVSIQNDFGGVPAGSTPTVDGLRVGIPVNHFNHLLTNDVEDAWGRAGHRLESGGACLVDVRVPPSDELASVVETIVAAEAAAFHHERLARSAHLFNPDVRRELRKGKQITAEAYLEALKDRAVIGAAWHQLFDSIDVLLTPTVPAVAPSREDPCLRWEGGLIEDAITGLTRYCTRANVAGLPALQVPLGLSASGLPLGVQLVGPPFSEALLLNTGRYLCPANAPTI